MAAGHFENHKCDHIYYKELHAARCMINEMLQVAAAGTRLIVIVDSAAALAALREMTSSDEETARWLEELDARLMRQGVRLTVTWVASADNPADNPSRARPVEPKSEEWWEAQRSAKEPPTWRTPSNLPGYVSEIEEMWHRRFEKSG